MTQVESDSQIVQADGESANVDASGFEKEAEGTPEIEVPFDPTKIDIIVRPMTIGALEARLLNAELDLTPDFQRQANVWNNKRKARLIESILLRIPLPSFYFSEDHDGTYAVVDGLQRLCAIFHFMRPSLLEKATGSRLQPLRLTELQYLKELEGQVFDDIDRKFQRRIAELEITTNVIRASTPPAVKFNVFARLNQGGMPLNAQEIRNAIFPGRWRVHVAAMAKSPSFLLATDGKVRTERQQDLELVLRFLALWQLGPPFDRKFSQTLDEFLNQIVEKTLSQWSDDRWKEAEFAFDRALRWAIQLFGRHAFRRSTQGYVRAPINRGLFEAQLLIISSLSNERLALLASKKDAVAKEFGRVLRTDHAFGQSLSFATASSDASATRINMIAKVFRSAADD